MKKRNEKQMKLNEKFNYKKSEFKKENWKIIYKKFEENKKAKDWKRIENSLKPQMYCSETSSRIDENVIYFKTEALLPYTFEKTKKVFESYTYMDLLADVNLKVENNHFKFQNYMIFENTKMTIECDVKLIDEKKRFTIVHYNYLNDYYRDYVMEVNKYQNGVKLVFLFSLYLDNSSEQTLNHYINRGRKLIYNLGDYLKESENRMALILMERDFYRRFSEMNLYPRILFQNERVLALSNDELTEFIFVGKQNLNFGVDKYIEILSNVYISNPFYSIIKPLNIKDKIVKHQESILFGNDKYSTDLIYQSRLIDGSVFVGCETYKNNECPHEHCKELEVILCAEYSESISDTSYGTIFYFHFKCLTLKEMPKHEILTRFNMLLNAVLISRLSIENRIPFEADLPQENFYDFIKIYLSKTLHFKMNYKSQKRIATIPVEKCIEKGRYDMTQIEDKLIKKIFSYLPKEDIMQCTLVCKKFNNIIKNGKEIWENFYDLYYNPSTFNKYNNKIEERIEMKNRTYYEVMKIAYKNKREWKNHQPKIKKRVEVFDKKSIDFIEIQSKMNCYSIGSYELMIRKNELESDKQIRQYMFVYKPKGVSRH